MMILASCAHPPSCKPHSNSGFLPICSIRQANPLVMSTTINEWYRLNFPQPYFHYAYSTAHNEKVSLLFNWSAETSPFYIFDRFKVHHYWWIVQILNTLCLILCTQMPKHQTEEKTETVINVRLCIVCEVAKWSRNWKRSKASIWGR